MSGLFDTLLRANADARLFARGEGWITAGNVRAMAAQAARRIESTSDAFLHTVSASRFVAGLLAASMRERRIILPAHALSAYLSSIGCAREALLNDDAIPITYERDAPENFFSGIICDPTLVFFTSGSTGAPKPVTKTLSRLEIEARALDRLWGAEAGFAHGTVSHQHIYGLLFRIVWPILSGRGASDEAAAYWEELADKLGPETTLVSSPAHLMRLAPNMRFVEPPRLVFSSGQALPIEAARECALVFGRPPIDVFGSTETGGIAWRRQIEPDAAWTPFADVRVQANEDGALEVRSAYLMSDAAYQTGDGVDLLANGQFHLRPRRDRIVKIDGKRVSLARVEEKLAALPQIESAAALALPHRRQALGAICALSEEGRETLAARGAFLLSRELRRACARELEPAERPKHWRFVAAIPVDSQGKRVLSSLQAMFDNDPLSALALDVRARSETEAEIAFRLAPELVFFRGHFPEHAILPGVALVHLAALISERIWGFLPRGADLARVKFRRVLRPRDDVVLLLSRDERRLRFSYRLGAIEASCGEIGAFES